VADNGEEARDKKLDSNSRDQQSGLTKTISIAITVAAILGGIAAAIAIWQFGEQASQSSTHSPAEPRMLAEQSLVSRLVPGGNYDRLQQIIGADPDIQIPFKSGNTIYQFNRPWEYIDLFVHAGRVLSVGVAAKTTRFKPKLFDDGASVTLNGAPIARQVEPSSTLGALGECATSGITYYFEGFPIGLPLSETTVVLGWDSTPVSFLVPAKVCAAVSAAIKCDEFDRNDGLSLKYSKCLYSLGLRQGIEKLSPSAIILTAPGQIIIPEMLNLAFPTG
jgi:hypothetical protein